MKQITAYHEAAHSVVSYRTAGSADRVSIVPHSNALGVAITGSADSCNEADIEAYVLSCYAGGHAQRVLDPSTGSNGCGHDDEVAADWLARFGWTEREQALRLRSEELVRQHWREIVAVAEQLLQCETLDETEVEILADGAAGDPDCDAAALARYRQLRGVS